MKVSEIMTENPVTVDPESTAKDAAKIMKEENLGTVLVAEGARLEGIVTDRQIAIKVVASEKDPKVTRVSEFMTKDPITVSPDMEIEEVSRIIGDNGIRRVPVVQSERLIGIISAADIADHARDCNICIENLLNEVAKAGR
ncbi:MAG: CBS domain-containing protein [Candidatus Methanoperedens sp.]|nr:CBS domain-containing protein [Candidatus Methanoperedens sp.]